MEDPVEQAFMDVCAAAGIRYERPERMGGRVDFYLPDFELFVEVKAYSCERLHEQLESIDAGRNAAMVLIGVKSVAAFARMIGATKNK